WVEGPRSGCRTPLHPETSRSPTTGPGEGSPGEPVRGPGHSEAVGDSQRGLAGEGEMKTRYLPFEKAFDEESSRWGVIGKDTQGEDFGVGVGETVEVAAQRLRSWVLDSLLASAADGVDALGDLRDAAPASDDSISLSP